MKALALLLVPTLAHAEADAPRHHGNLRLGGAGDSLGPHQTLCLEVVAWNRLSFEACGTGSELLTPEPIPGLSHYAAKWRLLDVHADGLTVGLQAAFGFAELQLGADDAGFVFDGVDSHRSSTAGAEAGLSLRGLHDLGGGFELVMVLGVGLAYLPHADELESPQSPWQPSLSLSVGAGF